MKGSKKLFVLCATTLTLSLLGCAPFQANVSTPVSTQSTTNTSINAPVTLKTKILFINTSRNPRGNTYAMGETFLQGVPHDTLFLNDYKIYQLGQHISDDQFNDVLHIIAQADTIVIGTPIYWHTMSGGLKTFIDRLYELDRPVGALQGKKLYFLTQGMAPTEDEKSQLSFIFSRVANRYNMEFMGAATDPDNMSALQNVLHKNLN